MPTSTAPEPSYPTRGAHLFQPPTSPQTAASSSTADYFTSRARKRQRPDSSHSQTQDATPEQHTPWSAGPSWLSCATPSDAACLSSGPAVNERYRLAGGYDTPGLLATSETEQAHDQHFRRCVRDMELPSRQESGQSTVSGPLARERNGAARLPSSPNGNATQGQGWTSYAFGLVGKVFTFSTSVIKGFYAGGGKGFDLHHQQQSPSPSDSWLHPHPHAQERIHTPVPGAWQSDDFLGDFEQDNPQSPTTRPRPPNKRRQTDRDSWVIVGTPEANPLDTSPKRKPSSSTPRPSLGPRSSASRANSRRSLAPISRRQSSYTTSISQQPQATPTSHLEAPAINRRASLAQTRASNSRPSSSGGGAGNITPNATTYITPETERYLKRQARQEKAAERAMNSMSKQLEDLIRQGREALGTKVEVEGDAESAAEVDEGFVDEEW